MKSMKQFIKDQSELSRSLIQDRSKEQREQMTNSIKSLETELLKMSKDVQKVCLEVRSIAKTQKQQQYILERLPGNPSVASNSSRDTLEGEIAERFLQG
jgi:hypothetical protein